MKEEILKIINNFKDSKILVIGDLMLDEYLYGKVNRVSVEAPVPILEVEKIIYTPGGAANVARNVKSLGGKVSLAGVVGAEDRGKILKKLLEKEGINIQGIVIEPKRKTTLKTRTVAQNQQLVRIDQEDRNPISPETEAKILNFVEEKIKKINCIIISDYAKGVITESLAKKIIERAGENKTLCLVDPKGNDYSKYRGCNIITPNEKELAQALNIKIKDEGQFYQAGRALLSHVMSESVLVTRGDKGMVIFERNGKLFKHPAINKKARDVLGAGDTSIASFGLSLASGADLERAVIISSCACAVSVGKLGTAIVLVKELEEILENNLNRKKIENKAVFLDRDGTINLNEPEYLHRIEDFRFFPTTIPALRKLSKTDYKIIIVTNQSGIGRGYYKEEDMKKIHQWMVGELEKNNVRIDKIYYCPHHPDDNCSCRKPKLGMVEKAVQDFSINLKKSWVIGDDEKDIIMGRRAGLRTILVNKKTKNNLKVQPHYSTKQLNEAVDIIINS